MQQPKGINRHNLLQQKNQQGSAQNQQYKNDGKMENNDRVQNNKTPKGHLRSSLEIESNSKAPNFSRNEAYLQSPQASGQDFEVGFEQIIELKQQISDIWESERIPFFHRKLYILATKKLKRHIFYKIAIDEIKALQSKQSTIQKSMITVNARENCKSLLFSKNEIEPQLGHLRTLTIKVCEAINVWQQELESYWNQSIVSNEIFYPQFIYKGKNYLLTISNDSKFSNTSNSIDDPFFLSSLKSEPQIELPLMSRIRACEMSILKEKTECKKKEIGIFPLNIFEDEALNFFERYCKSVPKHQIANNIHQGITDFTSFLEDLRSMQELNWIKIAEIGNLSAKGLCIFSTDKENFTSRKIKIHHFSTVNDDIYESLLQKCLEFIWKNDPHCSEISISPFYQGPRENYKVHPEFSQILKKNKFRWKSMQSENVTGVRSILYAVNRPLNLVSQINHFEHHTSEPITFCQASVLIPTDITVNSIKVLDCECSLLQINVLSTLVPPPFQKKILKTLKQKKYCPPGTKEEPVSAFLNHVKEIFPKYEIKNPSLLNYFQNAQESQKVSISQLCFRWQDFDMVPNYKQKPHIRIKADKNEEGFIQGTCKLASQPMYLIPTDDPTVQIYIVRLNNSEAQKIKGEGVNNFIVKCIHEMDKHPAITRELWIPIFKKQFDFHTVKSNEQQSEQVVLSAKDLSIQYQQPIKASLKIKGPSDSAVVFEPPFIFGMLKVEDFELFELPLLSCLVDNQDLIS